MMKKRWRVGRAYGIHVYEVGPTSPEGDRPVATFHYPQDAELAVQCVNMNELSILRQHIVNTVDPAQRGDQVKGDVLALFDTVLRGW